MNCWIFATHWYMYFILIFNIENNRKSFWISAWHVRGLCSCKNLQIELWDILFLTDKICPCTGWLTVALSCNCWPILLQYIRLYHIKIENPSNSQIIRHKAGLFAKGIKPEYYILTLWVTWIFIKISPFKMFENVKK